MKCLIIGDVHSTPSELAECYKLIDLILESARKYEVDHILFLGDLYNTMAVVNLFVFQFWQKSLTKLGKEFPIISLVGNHDLSSVHGNGVNSLQLHADIKNLTIVKDVCSLNGITYVGYQHTEEEFLQLVNKYSNDDLLVCHQTFNGARFDNGFYAQDGFDLSKVPHKQIISGHIHSASKIGKLTYLGSPRWRIVSDANVEKFIYVMEHTQGNQAEIKAKIPTNPTCTPIYQFKDTPDLPFNQSIDDANVTVDIFGPVNYIKTRNIELSALGYRVRTFPEKNFTSNVKESDGIRLAMEKFCNGYTSKNGTESSKLLNLLKNRISWMA